MVGEILHQVTPRLLRNAQNRGQGLWHEGWIGQWGKFDEPDAIFKLPQQPICHLQRQASLTTPAGARERQQALEENCRFTSAISRFRPTKVLNRPGILLG